MNILDCKVVGPAMIASALLLAGCGGSASDSDPVDDSPVGDSPVGDSPVGDSMGTLNLNVSDSPIKDAAKVCIKFDGVELKMAGDSPSFNIEFDEPVVINLLANQGAVSETLVSAEVEAGTYQWIRLMVDAVSGSGAGISDPHPTDPVCNDTENGSYLVTDGIAVYNLWVPSGDQTGLKLIKDIVVPANSSGDYTAEWDLGMSFVAPPGQGTGEAIMRPVVKLVANDEVGTLSGTVTDDFFVVPDGEDTATCPADSEFAPMVYVFGDDGNAEIAVDSDGADGTRDPVASGLVTQDMDSVDMPYVYEIGFLTAGDYEVAFSCDDRDTFIPETGTPATIEVDTITEVDIAPDDPPILS
jgi:hypothetical protein